MVVDEDPETDQDSITRDEYRERIRSRSRGQASSGRRRAIQTQEQLLGIESRHGGHNALDGLPMEDSCGSDTFLHLVRTHYEDEAGSGYLHQASDRGQGHHDRRNRFFQTRDFNYVSNMVDAHMLVSNRLIDQKEGGFDVWTIGAGRESTLKELIEIIVEKAHSKSKIVHKEFRPGEDGPSMPVDRERRKGS